MKIAIIGPGAMGLLYGAGLSQHEEVVLIGNNPEHIKEINEKGITVKRNESVSEYSVRAVMSGEELYPVELVILFTKAYLTKEALECNRSIIGKDTAVLTLQNGVGHELSLGKLTDMNHILIGTTAQGSYRENAHTIVNSGLGDTVIGSISDSFPGLEDIATCFRQAGFPCIISDDIRQAVWNKLMINASSSVLSGVLQKSQGYVAENPFAWSICEDLIKEICMTANAENCKFNVEEQLDRIKKHLENAPGGFTSIYADIKNGRKTEVDYISGAVVRAAKKHNIAVPTQELMVKLVHAME